MTKIKEFNMAASDPQYDAQRAGTSANKRIFIVLWVLCVVGSWSVLPYMMHLLRGVQAVSFVKIFFLATAQSMLLFGVACWLSHKLVPKTDLLPFSKDKPLKRILYPGLISGLTLGFVILLLDNTLFKSSHLTGVHPPAWMGLLASFYGGINEEVLLRLFFFTAVYFLLHKAFRLKFQKRFTILWVVNVIVAIAFGIGHLPAAFKLVEPSNFEIMRVLLLNGIPGIVFGWLYWSRGIWAAMTSHFVVDLVIHVLPV